MAVLNEILFNIVTLIWMMFFVYQDGSGTVTAGNSSGINDGAAAIVVASQTEVKRREATPLAEVVAWAQAGVDPAIMGTGPIPAVRAAVSALC